MARLNILVTGVGAIIGYGIVKALRMTKRKLNVIGMDIYEDAVGQHFCDAFMLAERADAPNYIDFLLDVIRCRGIDLIFFGTEQEIYRVSDSIERLPELTDRFVLNDKHVIELARDKLRTYQYLCQHGIDTIPTREDGSFEEIVQALGAPFILKLRHSYASKGVFVIHDADDFKYRKKKAGGGLIAQQLVGDDAHEYTAAVFGLGDAGVHLNPFILRRTLSNEGATSKAYVENIPELRNTIEQLMERLRPVGPTNLQYRYHNGKYLLLEINARISSSASIRAAFGYNEAEMCIQYYLENGRVSIPSLKTGSAVRYVADWIIHEDRHCF